MYLASLAAKLMKAKSFSRSKKKLMTILILLFSMSKYLTLKNQLLSTTLSTTS